MRYISREFQRVIGFLVKEAFNDLSINQYENIAERISRRIELNNGSYPYAYRDVVFKPRKADSKGVSSQGGSAGGSGQGEIPLLGEAGDGKGP